MDPKLVHKKQVAIRGVSIISIALILIIWTVSTNLKWVEPIFLPTPQSVWRTFLELVQDGYKGASLSTHILNSLYRLFISLILAIFTAVPLGILCGYSKYILAIFDPIIEFYRPLPPLAYYALLVLWLGIDNKSKVALLFLSAFAPLFISTVSSVQRVPQDRINGALSLGASKQKVFLYIILPSCLPDIITGLRTAIGVTYATLVAAEMVAATSGIGWMVLDASKYLRSDIVFVGIILMGVIAILMDGIIRWYQHLKFSWVGKQD
ncbi:ABC transporter permease [Bacillus methanolicus]|uniref:Taurine ABC transporter inner membrane protein n=1 Tax=Bacillus methanolicus (strain MGA3 / ATCC 53907) TaxID=796606 RepID=I3EB72_BACMM|nr:ABC transporter permease subunit [Bacillus methanolicus]AIE61425.1 taurine ABC transporter inner membrane protein [Bacillus methanolicus MGA3]EIJ83743.1 putative taurine ABC transporter, permease protein [Bacillus methanolicus MGA3]